MAKCIIVSGTRVCSDSPYRVNGGPKKNFPTLSRARSKARHAARKAITALKNDKKLGIQHKQQKLANDLLDTVLASHWSPRKTANARQIIDCVRLFLVDEVPITHGDFTLISY